MVYDDHSAVRFECHLESGSGTLPVKPWKPSGKHRRSGDGDSYEPFETTCVLRSHRSSGFKCGPLHEEFVKPDGNDLLLIIFLEHEKGPELGVI